MIMSYVGTNKRLQDAYLGGEVALELSPQGTIAERLRAGGAGMPGIFTRTGAGKSSQHVSGPFRADTCRDLDRDRRNTSEVLAEG